MIKGILKKKTVVLVTHQLQYLSQCDYIYVLKDGKVVEKGKYSQLMDNNKDFAALLSKKKFKN